MTDMNIKEQTLRQKGVSLHGVCHGYGRGEFAKTVIDECSLHFEPEKLTVIVGPSGCGKSTLVKLIAGFDRPQKGTVTLDGAQIMGPGPDRLVVFQEAALFSWMSTLDNIMFGPLARGQSVDACRKRAKKLADTVGLTAFIDKFPTQLSGGMQRRAELARALINEPRVMLLDEPFRGLDAMTKTLMQEYFLRLVESERRTCIFVTSDIDEAILLADRLFVMTNLPCRLAAEFTVDLPRPRSLQQVIESDHANQIKFKALEVLHAEAMRSFVTGSKAAGDFLEAYALRANHSSN